MCYISFLIVNLRTKVGRTQIYVNVAKISLLITGKYNGSFWIQIWATWSIVIFPSSTSLPKRNRVHPQTPESFEIVKNHTLIETQNT